MFGVWSCNVDGLASGQHFRDAVRDLRAGRASELFRALFGYVMDCRDLHPFIARQKSSMNAGNISGAEKTDLEFGHRN
jgi:hypothetical protein